MNYIYIKNWGIPIGTFDETDIKLGKDKEILKAYQEEYPQYKYTNAKIIKENNIRKLVVLICDVKDMKI